MTALRVIFMGTPEFAVPALESIIKAGHEVIAVYTKAPRPKGRGQVVQKSEVHICAEAHSIPVFHPASFKKDPDAIEQFIALRPDISVVAAYGLILPQAVLDAPRYGCLNIHGSLLPRWRGASPIQHAVWFDDKETGVTIMQMTAGLDEGDMILSRVHKISNEDNTLSLYRDLALLGAEAVVETLARYQKGEMVEAVSQDPSLVTYARLLSKEDGVIDWAKSARAIDCAVRALNPWPATYTYNAQKRLKILSGGCVSGGENGSGKAGTIINEQGDVLCGDGHFYRLKRVQFDNASAIDFTAALNGKFLNIGDVLQ